MMKIMIPAENMATTKMKKKVMVCVAAGTATALKMNTKTRVTLRTIIMEAVQDMAAAEEAGADHTMMDMRSTTMIIIHPPHAEAGKIHRVMVTETVITKADMAEVIISAEVPEEIINLTREEEILLTAVVVAEADLTQVRVHPTAGVAVEADLIQVRVIHPTVVETAEAVLIQVPATRLTAEDHPAVEETVLNATDAIINGTYIKRFSG